MSLENLEYLENLPCFHRQHELQIPAGKNPEVWHRIAETNYFPCHSVINESWEPWKSGKTFCAFIVNADSDSSGKKARHRIANNKLLSLSVKRHYFFNSVLSWPTLSTNSSWNETRGMTQDSWNKLFSLSWCNKWALKTSNIWKTFCAFIVKMLAQIPAGKQQDIG